MRMEKLSVPLRAVVPSEANPRRDFGDIKALAAAIEATGGQCVNPPVVVKDGNAWRVVDGERRLRALRLVWGEVEGAEVDVLACEDYDAADEAVAMLATDDKKQLTEEEKAAGAQRMLLLGVDDVRVAGAAGVDVTTVRRARRMVTSADEHPQASLEQLAAAAELGGGEDAEAVLSASATAWRGELAAAKQRRRNRERHAEMVSAFEAIGGRVLGEGEEVPEEGYHFWRYAYEADNLPADATGWLGAAWGGGNGLRLYEPGEEAEDPEKAALELRKAAHREDVAEMAAEMCRFAFGEDGVDMAHPAAWRYTRSNLLFAVVDDRNPVSERFSWPGCEGSLAFVQKGGPSTYEVAEWLVAHVPRTSVLNYDGTPSRWEAERLVPAYEALEADGWQPSEAAGRVYAIALQALEGAGE